MGAGDRWVRVLGFMRLASWRQRLTRFSRLYLKSTLASSDVFYWQVCSACEGEPRQMARHQPQFEDQGHPQWGPLGQYQSFWRDSCASWQGDFYEILCDIGEWGTRSQIRYPSTQRVTRSDSRTCHRLDPTVLGCQGHSRRQRNSRTWIELRG